MTPESSPAKKVLAALAVPVVLFAAVIVQLTVVNRLPLPGAAAPDLVLLFVVAVAVCGAPLPAAVTGFAGGLALDVAPPSTHYAGEYALIFCLAAWGGARVKAAIEHFTGEWDTMTALGVMAAAVVAGEAGKAALGLLLSDPDVTVAAIKHVLPVALVYDLLLVPLVAWPVALVARRPAPERAPRPEFDHARRLGPVFRLASAGAAPGLRLAGTGQRFQPNSQWRKARARRVRQPRLYRTRSSALARTVAAYSAGTPVPVARGRTLKLNFASGRRAGTPSGPRHYPSPAHAPRKNWLAASARSARPAPRPSKSPGKGWLRSPFPSSLRGTGTLGNVAVAGSKGLSGSRAFSRTARRSASPAFSRGSRSSKRPVFSRGALSSPSGPAFSRGAGFSAGAGFSVGAGLSGAAVLSARSAPSGLSALPNLSGRGATRHRRAPSAGWLRDSSPFGPSLHGSAKFGPAAPRRLAPRRGWLRGARRPGGIPHGNWYTASPSGAWLRRSHHPWRSFRPGGRPPVPPGARPMAKSAIASGARRFSLFGRKGWRQ